MSKILYSLILTVSVLFLLQDKASAQSVAPTIFNVAGGYTNPGAAPGTGYYQYEYSVGELTMIETFTIPNYTFTQGVLQPCTDKVLNDPLALIFHKGEYVLFPNPTTGKFELDFLLKVKGQLVLQLVDNMGRVIETREFHYDGCGRIERFDINRLADGIYTLHATLRGDEKRGDGLIITRNSAFRIVKVR